MRLIFILSHQWRKFFNVEFSQATVLLFAMFYAYFIQIGSWSLIGASLSDPHTGWSLSWFHTSRVRTIRTIKYGWQAIQVLSWFHTSCVRTVRTIKYGWQAIQVLSWFRMSRVRTVRTIKYGWQAIQVLSWSRTLRVRTVRTIKYDGQAIQCFICCVCRLWVLRGQWSEGRET